MNESKNTQTRRHTHTHTHTHTETHKRKQHFRKISLMDIFSYLLLSLMDILLSSAKLCNITLYFINKTRLFMEKDEL